MLWSPEVWAQREVATTHFVALYAWARPVAGDHDTRTLIEAESDGWWYTAKLPDATRVVVPHVDRENASAIFHTAGEWEARLGRTSHISQTLAGASFEGPPRGAEACGARLDRFSGRGLGRRGRRRAAFDPLSSQGILTALYAGMGAAHAIDADLAGGREAISAYCDRLEEIRSAYVTNHRSIYFGEQRWAARRFWARRQSVG